MNIIYKSRLVVFLLFLGNVCFAQNKILFDASKAQSAGNADWVIDASLFNIYFSSGPAIVNSGGNESNPARFPLPAQSTVTATTAEDYWNGGISYWGIDCAKKGYVVETLPYNGQITYGNASNIQDLSNYKAFIVVEPNIIFSAAEKTAILNYVANGGGLFMIADHDVSDRNNDGDDSPHIWNDLMTNNSVQTNPFGISFDYVSLNQTSNNVANLPSNPILHGTAGNVTQIQYSAGATMTLNTIQNSSVKGVIFKTGSSTTGTTNVLCAYAIYGAGKVAAIGDSSISDDGTGDPNDILYDGYIADANGNHQKLLMNITNWLMVPNLDVKGNEFETVNMIIAPNPIQNNQLHLSFSLDEMQPIELAIYDNLGRNIKQISLNANTGVNYQIIDLDELQSGMYICTLTTATTRKSMHFEVK